MAPESTAVRLDGKRVAATLIEQLQAEVAALPYAPKLVFVRVGDDPASASYVRSKERMAQRAGISSQVFLTISVIGYMWKTLNFLIRIILAISGILLIIPNMSYSLIGLLIGMMILAFVWFSNISNKAD